MKTSLYFLGRRPWPPTVFFAWVALGEGKSSFANRNQQEVTLLSNWKLNLYKAIHLATVFQVVFRFIVTNRKGILMNKALFFAFTMTLISLPNMYSAEPGPKPSAPFAPGACAGACEEGCVEEKRPLYPRLDSVFGPVEDPAAGGWRCVATLPKPPANDKEAEIADAARESAGWINSHSLAWNPLNPNMIASGGLDGKVRIWSISTGECRILEFVPTEFELEIDPVDEYDEDLPNLHINSVAWSHNGALIAAGFESGIVRVWNVSTGKCILEILSESDPVLFECGVTSVSFNCHGTLAFCSRDQKISIFDFRSGERIYLAEPSGYAHEGGVNTVEWDSTGTLLVSGGHDHIVRVWDVLTGTCIKTLKGHTDNVMSVMWNDRGELVSCGLSGSLFLWDLKSEKAIAVDEGVIARSYSATLDPSGRLAAVGHVDSKIAIWDIKTRAFHNFGTPGIVNLVVWGQDGRLASCGSYGIEIMVQI
jgi:WD40 repeat protein